MNVPVFIAKRYFLFGRKLNFINIISVVTIFMVSAVTIALVVSLSVFNGMEDLIRNIFHTFDSNLKVSAVSGKTFIADDAFLKKIKATEGVEVVSEIIEDDAFLLYDKNREVVKIKGVSDNYTDQHTMDTLVVLGNFKLKSTDAIDQQQYYSAVIGIGIKNKLNLGLNNQFKPIQVYYPNKKKIKRADPASAFNIRALTASGFFAIEKRYDDSYVFVPLEFAQDLMDYDQQRTSLEIKVKDGYDIEDVKDNLKETLGEKYYVQNSDEQHASLLRAVKIEKLFMQVILSCIYGLASINIFFCLTLLVINKKKDMSVLLSMGATPGVIRKLFIGEGMIIAFTGVVTGFILGIVLCLLQQRYGIVSMGMQTSIVDAYPVKIEWIDLITISITVFVITVLASLRPAYVAASVELKEHL